MSDVEALSQSLRKSENREEFVTKRSEKTSDDSSDEETVIRVQTGASNGTAQRSLVDTNLKMMNELLKSQRRICNISSSLDQEEVSHRYTKLELSNTQIDLAEVRKESRRLQYEVYFWRSVFALLVWFNTRW